MTHFPRLFRLEGDKGVSVCDGVVWQDGSWCCNWGWIREPRGRASSERRTNRFGFLMTRGCFQFKRLIDSISLSDRDQNLACETKRNSLIPRKIWIFMWRL